MEDQATLIDYDTEKVPPFGDRFPIRSWQQLVLNGLAARFRLELRKPVRAQFDKAQAKPDWICPNQIMLNGFVQV